MAVGPQGTVGSEEGVTRIVVDAFASPPDAFTVTPPDSGAQTPNSGMMNVKLARPARSVVTRLGLGVNVPVTVSGVLAG
jgi:hypothetical protein